MSKIQILTDTSDKAFNLIEKKLQKNYVFVDGMKKCTSFLADKSYQGGTWTRKKYFKTLCSEMTMKIAAQMVMDFPMTIQRALKNTKSCDGFTRPDQKNTENPKVEVENATVEKGLENATVEKGLENATVEKGLENATVEKGLENATVEKGLENATVEAQQ